MPKIEAWGVNKMHSDERKKTVTFNDRQIHKINYICKDQGMSISEVIRNALDLYFEDIYGSDYPEFDEYIKREEEAWRRFER